MVSRKVKIGLVAAQIKISFLWEKKQLQFSGLQEAILIDQKSSQMNIGVPLLCNTGNLTNSEKSQTQHYMEVN